MKKYEAQEENQKILNQMRDKNFVPKDKPNSFDEFDQGTNNDT